MTRLAIVTPVYPPAIGGGAVYTELLTRELAALGIDSVVLTERHPERPDQSHPGPQVRVVGRFPHRAGRSERSARSYVDFAYQELQLARSLLSGLEADALLVHASFTIHSPVTTLALRMRRSGPPVIGDVRDTMLAPHRLQRLAPFNALVACSHRVEAHLGRSPTPLPRVERIHIPFEPPAPTGERSVLDRLGFEPGYVLYPHGVSEHKGTYDAVAAMERAWADGLDRPMLIVGRRRGSEEPLRRHIASGLIRVLDPLPHHEVLQLVEHAGATMSLGPDESVCRVTLESIALGTRTVCPPYVPEYAEAGLPVGRPGDAGYNAKILRDALDGPPADYDLSPYRPEAVATRYAELVHSLTSAR